jgi:hypothetical protein
VEARLNVAELLALRLHTGATPLPARPEALARGLVDSALPARTFDAALARGLARSTYDGVSLASYV